MNNFIIPRNDRRPARIKAELIGSGDTRKSPGGRENGRWTECFLYQLASGQYFVHIVGKTLHEGEVDRHWDAQASTPSALATAIEKKFGELHLAVQDAFKKASIWEEIAVSESSEEVEIEDYTPNEADRYKIIRPTGGYGPAIRARVASPMPEQGLPPCIALLYPGTMNPLCHYGIDEAEKFALGLLKAIDIAREAKAS